MGVQFDPVVEMSYSAERAWSVYEIHPIVVSFTAAANVVERALAFQSGISTIFRETRLASVHLYLLVLIVP